MTVSNRQASTPESPSPAHPLRTGEQALSELLKLLQLEKIEENIFRGYTVDLGTVNVFGGQVLGQALSAATQTVVESRRVHSMHAYFMRHGDPERPIVYNVDCIRDGKSFTTRRVLAVQKGKAIFSLAASFQSEEPGLEHQDQMPAVPDPLEIPSERELAEKMPGQLPERILERLRRGYPIEMRHINPVFPGNPQKMTPHKYVWFRTVAPMPDDPALHRQLLAYSSDFNLVPAMLYPHGRTIWETDVQAASLDHAMWFHRDFRVDDWLLYAIDSPNAGASRGLSIGRVFDRGGRLVATVMQEGLIRFLPLYPRRPPRSDREEVKPLP
jgi:acyl-CoA thioesterase-2